MENSYVLAILFAFSWLSDGTDGIPCSKGEKLYTPREGHDVCIMCDQGTFMDEENHSLKTCKPCTKIENREVEVHVSACNRTHDAEILCTSGFYRRRARNGRQTDRCEKCTACEFPARDCGGYYDTVCCPPNHDAVMSPSGVFRCEERPIVCGQGQFFKSRTEECTPCPDRTFMPAYNHRYHQCLKCEELSGNKDNHAVIIRPCSKTAPTLFGCEKGYFRDPKQESTQTEVPCTPCENCSHRNSRSRRNIRLPECSMFQDVSQNCKGEEKQGEEIQQVEKQGEEKQGEDIGGTNAISDGNGNKRRPQDSNQTEILDNKINFSAGNTNVFNESRGFENVWYLHLIFVILLLSSNLMLMLTNKGEKVMENQQLLKTLKTLCHYIKKTVNTVFQFTMIGLISLCIVFQIVVAMVKYVINTTAAEKFAVECTLMSLSIVNFAVCIIIFCKYRAKENDFTPVVHVHNDMAENKSLVA